MLVIVVTGMFVAVEMTSLQANPEQVTALTSLKFNLLWVTLPLLFMCLFISKLVLNRLVTKPLATLQARYQQAIDEKESQAISLCSPYIELDGLINLVNKELDQSAPSKINTLLSGQSKQQFVESLANNIRTPMNSILGAAELLCEMPQDMKSAEYLKLMQHSATHMQMVLNDVVDYSKIESGRLELAAVRFDLLVILDQVYTSLRPLMNHNLRVRFSLNYDEDLHRFYIGDPIRLQQVLVNLVANALKFTDRGFVELKVICSQVNERHENGAMADLVFTVSDSGIGIPETKLAHLFDNKQQPYNHKANDLSSGGLSLSICSRLINLMQGHLQVDSTLGEGAQFKINLRLLRAYQLRTQHIVGSNDLAVDKLVGLKVLLIEDDKINQLVTQQVMAQLQMQVITANNGLAALELMPKYNFDVIYMQIPGVDGIAATKILRPGCSDNIGFSHNTPPIIALVEDTLKFDLQRCLHDQMQGCINKPISRQGLIDETVRVLGFELPDSDVVLPFNKKIKVGSEE
jgi:signal transduction histidine kinase